jgi:outer membrane receptor for ferrienterochelin and colicins
MEGPYTMVLIDGMPIVSSLSTVYGLSGIPNSIVDRVEIVKGPGSSLYGSEAMGGIINIITKNPENAPRISADVFTTSWQEHNADIGGKFRLGKAGVLAGISYFNYQNPLDKNGDGFTDVTLQNRVSVFNKWKLQRKYNREASLAARYVYEDRWGGQMNWSKQWQGSDSVYGESINTKRWELIGMYQLPVKERIMLQLSYNWHKQDSWYGIHPYLANQRVAFAQAYWDRQFGFQHNFLLGATYRYTYYDDNTPGTGTISGGNAPMKTPLPGVFVQDEWTLNPMHTILAGYRYDYDRVHGSVHSPRIAYKWSPNLRNTIRASFGTGFRVVNLFTEDHAALTGARQVVIAESLLPERSYNTNLNYVKKLAWKRTFLNLDITGFYSYFTNKITGDFDTDPSKIIYRNLNGHAISRGISVNADASFPFPLKVLAGVTYMDVYQIANAGGKTEKTIQLHAPKWSGNLVATYTFPRNYAVDFTVRWNGPMRLPILPNDYRPEYSPLYCLANIQLTKKLRNQLEFYGGIKNLFNFIPANALMRPFDPFDKYVNDPVNNPNHYTFETSYNYAPLQGIRFFAGIRYALR